MEVASPNSTYELIIKTLMGKGTAVPKGRYNLPRETKEATKDRILVFAEGKQADEARRAGADIVGGPELVDGVRFVLWLSSWAYSREANCRSSVAVTKPASSFAPLTSSARSRPS